VGGFLYLTELQVDRTKDCRLTGGGVMLVWSDALGAAVGCGSNGPRENLVLIRTVNG